MTTPTDSMIRTQAQASWLCPVAAWASQIILTFAWYGITGLGLFWAVAAVVQFILIIAGLYLGLKVVSLGRSTMKPGVWLSAIMGVVLSAGTILLIVVLGFSS